MAFIIERKIDLPDENSNSFEIDRVPNTEKSIGQRFAEDYEELGEYIKSGVKGTLEGVQRLGRMMSPEIDLQGRSEKEIRDQFSQQIENLIPQKREENYLQRGMRRGLQQAPSMMAFPGSGLSMLPKSIAAGFIGEGAKDLGFPEWAQAAAEITAFLGPDLSKKLLEKGSNKEIIQAAKEFGLSDEQIAPLIQSEFKQKWLSKLAPKRGKTQKVLSETQKGLGEGYESLKSISGAAEEITPKLKNKLLNDFAQVAEDIPSGVREKVAQDFIDLVKKPITAKSLMNLHKDINKSLGPRTKELSRFKEPLRNALHEISPEIGEKFDKINGLYSRYSDIAGKLKPNIVSDLITSAEAIGFIGSAVIGDYATFGKLLAEQGLRNSARELLLNPRVNQLGEKFLSSLNQSKWGLASKIAAQIKEELQKNEPNIKIDDLSKEEIKLIFAN